MNDIIDVEYNEIVNLEDKTTEVLVTEANTIWEQMELIGNLGIRLAIQAGQRLNVIKERLGHGEWEPWAKENLKFSLTKANRMMKLAAKADDENSLFSNPSTLTDIGISKVYALLATSEEVAEKVLENPEVQDMSVRKLQEEIKKLEKKNEEAIEENKKLSDSYSEEKEKLTEAKAEAEANEQKFLQKISELHEEERKLNIKIRELEENPSSDEKEIERLEEELFKTENILVQFKDKLKAMEENKESEIKEAVNKAKENAKADAEIEAARQREIYLQLEKEKDAEIEKLKKAAKNNSDTDIIEFKVKSDILQEDFNDCLKSINTVALQNPEQAEKMKMALGKILEILSERV